MSTELATRSNRPLDRVGKYDIADIIAHQRWKSTELAQQANILFPVTALDQIPPMHKPSISLIWVDPQSADVYQITRNRYGLSKATILKMLNAAGASYKTEKLTPHSDLNFIRWGAHVWGRLPDGTFHQATASKAWSWEKCQEQMTPDQARKYREFADEQTETKALLRAARAFLNIQTAYTPEELQKPFLIARSVPDIDLRDPEIKRMVAQRLIDSTFAVYGNTPAVAPPTPQSALPEPPVTYPAFDSSETEDEDELANEPDSFESDRTPADPEPEAEAAEAELDELDAQVEHYRKTVTPVIWKAVLAAVKVVDISHASREQKLRLVELCRRREQQGGNSNG